MKTTQWTQVFRAASEAELPERPAMNELMQKYWQPLYFFARRQGLSATDAEDATQAFLANLLDGKFLATADPAKGRFRTYLLTHWKRFLIDRARTENRLKRGGGNQITSLYCADGERAWLQRSHGTVTPGDPDQEYYEEWAQTLVRTTVALLREEYAQSHRTVIFETLLPWITKPSDQAIYAAIAKQLGATVGAAKVALHRLRQRFGQSLRQQVLETIEFPADVNAEIEELCRYLSSITLERS